MIKKEKHVNGVFTEIVGTPKEISQYDRFLNTGPKTESKDLNEYTNLYRSVVTKWKSQFETVALLEEVILQLRCAENIKEIKLSLVKGEYIYARSPFYRRGGSTKDIRVIVGRTDIDGEDLDVLSKDVEFMERCKNKLSVAMSKTVASNKNILTKLLK
jgi:hypothetical protein